MDIPLSVTYNNQLKVDTHIGEWKRPKRLTPSMRKEILDKEIRFTEIARKNGYKVIHGENTLFFSAGPRQV